MSLHETFLSFSKGNLPNRWEVNRKDSKLEYFVGSIEFCEIDKRWKFTPYFDSDFTCEELKEISDFMGSLENLERKRRDISITLDVLRGLTYKECAQKYHLSNTRIREIARRIIYLTTYSDKNSKLYKMAIERNKNMPPYPRRIFEEEERELLISMLEGK